MSTKYFIVVLIITLGLFFFSSALSNVYADTGLKTPSAIMLANTCAGCHGVNGSSFGPSSPTIAGMSKAYFIETMEAYQSGERPSTIMTRIAKGYSKKEIELMADFFSKQAIVRHTQTYDAKAVKLGNKLHKKYCKKCHEDNGASANDDAGILAGQWQPFLRFTMEDYTSGKRPMLEKKQERVKKIFEEHGQTGIDALIQFYGSQK